MGRQLTEILIFYRIQDANVFSGLMRPLNCWYIGRWKSSRSTQDNRVYIPWKLEEITDSTV